MHADSPGRRKFLRALGVGAGGVTGLAAINALAPYGLAQERAFDPNHSYWSAALPPPNPPLRADVELDVVIVGGGLTGLSAAYYLSRTLPGRRIAVLEASRCGNGASGRNGAMVLNLKNSSVDAACARRLYDLTVDNIRTLGALAQAAGLDCELEHDGALTVMSNEAETGAARIELAALQSRGLPLEYWDRQRLAAAIGTECYTGAVFDPGAGQVHPGKLVRLWKSLAEAAGVRVYEHTVVTSIAAGAVHRLSTADGCTIRAPLLVLATNAYTSKLGFLRNAVAPIVNYVGITAPLEAAQLAAIGWNRAIPFNDSRKEVYYAGLTRDRRLHFGGGPVDYAFNDGVRNAPAGTARYAGLHREFARVFPALAAVPFANTWSGLVDVSLDEIPAVGQLGERRNIFYGIGYSGEGVNLTSVFGRIIADLAAGARARWAWFPYLDRRPPYIPNEPFRWLAVHADLAVTRLTGG